MYLVLPFFLFIVYLSFFSTKHYGIRYLLPVYPLIFVFIGKAATIWPRGLRARLVVAFLVTWLSTSTLWNWPNYLSYANELIGGSSNGYHYLSDSNLDWGQDLEQLAEYLRENGIERVQLGYFGTADPSRYGIDYEYLPSPRLDPTPVIENPADRARYVALSAYHYQGALESTRAFYDEYRLYEPNDIVGNTILIFDTHNLRPRGPAP